MAASTKKLSFTLAGLVVVGLAAGLVYWLWPPAKPNAAEEPERVFSGSTDRLQATTVVPALEAPIPEGKSAIWCISLKLAWDRLEENIVKEPIRLSGAQQVADWLNQPGGPSADDVNAGEVFALAGPTNDDIAGKIKASLDKRFPDHTMPPIKGIPGGYVACGYLRANVRYTYQFFNNREWLVFTQADGRQVRVRSFGLPQFSKASPIQGECRSQVAVLFREGGQFALDLSDASRPNQLILAKVSRRDTLAATLSELNEKLAKSQPKPLPASATLLVPNANWRVEHHFRELEGSGFQNPGMAGRHLVLAFQFVDFKMDRFGAAVESGAILGSDNGHTPAPDPNPDHYYFDRPFLIVLKKRGAKHPFFVMWVDNAELLCKH